MQQKKQTANVLREAAILHSVAHPFVLRCVCTFQSTDQIFMLLELVQAGDLWPYIYRKKVATWCPSLTAIKNTRLHFHAHSMT